MKKLLASVVFCAGVLVQAQNIPTYVQSQTTVAGPGSTSLAYPVNVSAGSALYAAVYYGAGTVLTLTDSQANPWTISKTGSLMADGDSIAVGCAMAGSSGADTVNFLVNGSPAYVFGAIYEVKNGSCVQDASAVTSDTTSQTACNSRSLTTNTANDLLFGMCGLENPQASFAPGSGWSHGETFSSINGIDGIAELQVAASPGSYTMTSGSYSPAGEQGAIEVAFKPFQDLEGLPAVIQVLPTPASSAQTLTYPANISAGSALYAVSYFGYPNADLSFADSQGNAWAVSKTGTLATDEDTIAIGCAMATSNGPDTVTFLANGTTSYVYGVVYEVKNSTCSQDVAAVFSDTAAQTACNSGALTTITPNDFLMGTCGLQTPQANLDLGPGWFYGQTFSSVNGIDGIAGTQVAATPGSYTMTSGTYNPAGEQGSIEAAFKPALVAAATPTFSPGGGSYSSPVSVTMSSGTSGATIYYTTDGSTPTTSSTTYTAPITVSATQTLKAIATATGYSQSPVASATYTISGIPLAATPRFFPPGGSFPGTINALITDPTPNVVIFYTTDGTTPTTDSISCRNNCLVSVDSSTTVKAIATASGYAASPVAMASYTITAPVPTILGVSPVGGSVGTSVTISGMNFGSSGTLTFNGVQAVPTSWGIDTITVPVPTGAITGPIVVTTDQGTSNSYAFTVGAGISGISPTAGSVGTVVVISGAGFGNTQGTGIVRFNGVAATPSNWSNTSITVPVPSGATTGTVSVVINGVSVTGPLFTLAPVITTLSPAAGPIGTTVRISGSNFGAVQGTSTVFFGQTAAVPTQWSQGTIVVPVPAAAVSGSVVATVSGVLSNAVPFTVGATVTGSITGTVTQSDGVTPVAGATVTILNGSTKVATTATSQTGAYSIPDLSATTYKVQATAAGFGSATQSSVSVQPNQATVVNLALTGQRIVSYTYDKNGRLTTVGDSASGSATYSYDAVGNILSIARSGTPQVSILGFSPTSGPVGTQVTISGTGFASIPSQNTVTIGGVNASIIWGTPTQLVVTVPAAAQTGAIALTAPGGTSTSSASFTVTSSASLAEPSIDSFTPNAGSAGTVVSISGNHFDSDPTNDLVTFNGTVANVTSATATNLLVDVPEGATAGPLSVATPVGSTVSSAIFNAVPDGYSADKIDFDVQLNLGDSYSGSIHSASDIGIAVFNANAGQQINLAVSGSTLSGQVSVLGPDGSLLQRAFVAHSPGQVYAIYNGSVPVTGYYTVLVSPSGTGNVTLSLSTNATGSITPGVARSIAVTSPDQSVELTFSGTAGQYASVQLANSTLACSVGIYILSPDGVPLDYSGNAGCPVFFAAPVALPVTGTYTLVFDQGVQSGLDSANATVTLFVFDQPNSVSMQDGTPAAVTLSTPGQSAQFSFSGTAGQSVTAQVSGIDFPWGVQVSIASPDGTTLAVSDGPSLGPVPLLADGTYTLMVSPDGGDTGNVTAALAISPTAITIRPGTPASFAIDIPGKTAQFTFSGATGQYASISLSSSTFSTIPSISILNSTGTTLYSTAGNAVLGPGMLQNNDIYTVLITPNENDTGSATAILSLSGQQSVGGISSGTEAPFTIASPGETSRFSFTGAAGQIVSAKVSSPFACHELMSITNPDQTSLEANGSAYNQITSDHIDPVTLPVSGTYTLVISPGCETTGTSSALLWLFANQTDLSISPGVPVGINVNIPGQNVQLSFTGLRGQHASAQLSNNTFAIATPNGFTGVPMSIINPDGTTLTSNFTTLSPNFNGQSGAAYSLNPALLPVTGTYKLVIAPQSLTTGSANVNLLLQ